MPILKVLIGGGMLSIFSASVYWRSTCATKKIVATGIKVTPGWLTQEGSTMWLVAMNG